MYGEMRVYEYSFYLPIHFVYIYTLHVMFNFEKIFYEYTEKRARDKYNSLFDEQDCRRW